jgi:hypothetical protein
MWMPMQVPPKRAMMDPWPLLGFWTRVVGFFLLFVGALVAVAGASPTGTSCSSASACSSFVSQAADSILAARILWILGLGALGAGAAIRLHWGLRMPDTAKPDQVTWILADRRMNGLVFLVSIILMLVILVDASFVAGVLSATVGG